MRMYYFVFESVMCSIWLDCEVRLVIIDGLRRSTRHVYDVAGMNQRLYRPNGLRRSIMCFNLVLAQFLFGLERVVEIIIKVLV